MTETECKSLLTILLNRDEEMEAVKLVRLQLGYSISQAKAFIEKTSSKTHRLYDW